MDNTSNIQSTGITPNILTYPNINIGNYKGVMLCNRPFNGNILNNNIKSQLNANNKDITTPFITGVVTSNIGQNVPIYKEPLYTIKRDKTSSALSKHKKWLSDLQKERGKLEKALEEENENAQKQRQKFFDSQAKKREQIRNTKNCINENSNENDNIEECKSNIKVKVKSKSKPMWALTKELAEEKKDYDEDKEVDDLIEFANNLDIDKFLQATEAKATIEELKYQMEQLQEIIKKEENDIKKDELLEKLKETQDKLSIEKNNNIEDNDNDNDNDNDDIQSIVSSTISESKSIRSVHSKRSIAAITKRVKDKLKTITDSSVDYAFSQHANIPSPTIAIHNCDNNDGIRLKLKEDPNQLPYMHRNPAI